MSLRRICIIALDALEYDLVEELNLENIKQLEYGKIDVSNFKDLATPIIWASFISGLPPEEHGLEIEAIPHWSSSVIDNLRQLTIRVGLDRIKGKGRLLELLGFEHRPFYEEMVTDFRITQTETVFDIIPNAKALSVPPYQKWIAPETQLFLRQAIDNEEKMNAFEEHVLRIFERKKGKCLKTLGDGDWSLFMTHFMFTDLLGHLYAGNATKMFGVYIKAEQLAEDAKKLIDDETLFLIVSDHGMKRIGKGTFGEHSDHGFYSSNIPLNLKHPKMTDFFPLIVKTVSEDEKEANF